MKHKKGQKVSKQTDQDSINWLRKCNIDDHILDISHQCQLEPV